MLYLILCLSVLGTGGVLANSVPVDELSLSNGAYLYDLYCSECHGVNTSEQGYGPNAGNETEQEYDFSELIDIAQDTNSPKTEATHDSWPDWVKYPKEQGRENEFAARSEILNEITQVIDEAYGIEPEQAETEIEIEIEADFAEATEYEQSTDSTGVFDPIPGVTNLADPQSYFYGYSEDEMFNSIANGTGESMPGWRIELGSDESIWDLVNYIRSFWSEDWLY